MSKITFSKVRSRTGRTIEDLDLQVPVRVFDIFLDGQILGEASLDTLWQNPSYFVYSYHFPDQPFQVMTTYGLTAKVAQKAIRQHVLKIIKERDADAKTFLSRWRADLKKEIESALLLLAQSERADEGNDVFDDIRTSQRRWSEGYSLERTADSMPTRYHI